MQLQQKFAFNIAVESEFFVHFFIRREMCNSPIAYQEPSHYREGFYVYFGYARFSSLPKGFPCGGEAVAKGD